ncbi:MAG: hypothetical protein ACLP9C_14995 [Acidimicrobiales bacterium]
MPDPGDDRPADPGDAGSVAALQDEVRRLRAENTRLKEELGRVRREQHESPPHYR